MAYINALTIIVFGITIEREAFNGPAKLCTSKCMGLERGGGGDFPPGAKYSRYATDSLPIIFISVFKMSWCSHEDTSSCK